MRVGILGAGAMGSVFGYQLAREGVPVVVVDVWREHIAAIQRDGLKVETPNGLVTTRVPAASSPDEAGEVDLLIVFVKGYQTTEAVRNARPMWENGARVLTLQNGLGNAEAIAAVVGPERVLCGATSQGGIMLGPGRVRHTTREWTYVGPFAPGSEEQARAVVDLFASIGMRTDYVADPQSLIWSKLMVNVAFNALTAITRLKNGDFTATPEGQALMQAVVEEAMAVAQAKGIKLIYEDPVRHCIDVGLGGIAENRSSMLQDILRGTRSEIDTINGAIVAQGAALGIPTPVNETVKRLVRIVDQTHPQRQS